MSATLNGWVGPMSLHLTAHVYSGCVVFLLAQDVRKAAHLSYQSSMLLAHFVIVLVVASHVLYPFEHVLVLIHDTLS